MKTEKQVRNIAEKAQKNGVKYVVDIDRYGKFNLYKVVNSGGEYTLLWQHQFPTFKDAAKWVADCRENIEFIPYIA